MKRNDDEIFTPSGGRRSIGAVINELLHRKRPQDDEEGELDPSQPLEQFFGDKAREEQAKDERPERQKIDWSAITQNRLYLGIGCVVLALLIGFVFTPLSAHLASIKTVKVLRASADIPMGALITAEMLAEVEISAQNVPKTAVTDPTKAVGKYAIMDIAKEENLLSTKLAELPPQGNAYLSELANGDLAVSVSVKSFAAGLSGKLIPGDIVTVYANLSNNPNQYDYRSALISELYYVEVLAVSNEDVGDTSDYEPDPENSDGRADTLPTTVTLRCINLEQARVLTGLEANSAIHLALICRNDEAYKQELLDAQEQYFILLALQQIFPQQQDNTSSSESTLRPGHHRRGRDAIEGELHRRRDEPDQPHGGDHHPCGQRGGRL